MRECMHTLILNLLNRDQIPFVLFWVKTPETFYVNVILWQCKTSPMHHYIISRLPVFKWWYYYFTR